MGRPVKETDLLTWNGSAWVRVGSGDIYDYTSGGTSAATMAVGGGYGDTGATIAADGNISTNGTLTVDGASTLKGAVTVTGALTANGGITCDTDKFAVADTTGNTAVGGTLAVTGTSAFTGAVAASSNVVAAGYVTGLRRMNTEISGASATLAVATSPSGSVIVSTAASCTITLPALTAGCTYTFIHTGNTNFTLTGPSACVLIDGTTVKTNLVWSTTPANLSITVVSTASNWIVTSYTTAIDSSS